jgi:hypothetical protein
LPPALNRAVCNIVGGVISPLLANVVLNKLDWFLHAKGAHKVAGRRAWYHGRPNLRFVRYAHDWCVLTTRASKQYAETLREEIREFLAAQCGLRLSEEKTHITHVRDGFEFLGFRLEMSIGQQGSNVPKIKVPREAVTNAQRGLAQAMRYRPQQESVASRIVRGSAVVRGWSHYYKIAHNYADVASSMDHFAYWIAVKAICRKQDISTGQCLRKFAFGSVIGVHPTCTLAKYSDTSMSLDYRGPEAYVPGNGDYQTDQEMEADFRIHEKVRAGSMDLKYQALTRDGSKCRKCGRTVTAATSQADHIIPVKQFASFAEAHTPDNVQTLCLDCHEGKTHAK